MSEEKKLMTYCKGTLNLVNRKLGNEYYYSSLPLAVIDAVFSVGIKYSQVTKIVDNYCAAYDIDKFADRESIGALHNISDLIANIEKIGVDEFAVNILQSSHRTMGKNSILKADAVYQWAKKLKENQIETFTDLQNADLTNLEKELRIIQGQDEAVVKYFLMLCGDEDMCKPDRHILKFLSDALGYDVKYNEAQTLLTGVVSELKADCPDMTVRLLDYIIWDYQSKI